MAGAESLKLVARLSGVGLLFDISDLIEVVAAVDAHWEVSEAESLGDVRFRGALLPVFAGTQLLSWGSEPTRTSGSILVFEDVRSSWGVLVDEVAGIYPAGEFIFHDVPAMLRRVEQQSYKKLALWNSEPLLCCDLDLLDPRRCSS